MIEIDWSVIGTLITALVTIGGFTLKYQETNSRFQYLLEVSNGFHKVVSQLSSESESERLAGSILLRRFFDTDTELGSGVPFADDAINVISALLRSSELNDRPDMRKTLADSLAYAPSLKHADLQRTNLQDAFFGKVVRGSYSRKVAADNQRTWKRIFFSCFNLQEEKEVVYHQAVNLEDADFFRADVSGANFAHAKMKNAVFYQTRCAGTVFRNTDLSGVNFRSADLQGARFKNATLAGADFTDARNIPHDIKRRLLKDGTYDESMRDNFEDDPVPKVFHSYGATISTKTETQTNQPKKMIRNRYLFQNQNQTLCLLTNKRCLNNLWRK